MEDLLKNKLLWVVVAVMFIGMGTMLVSNVVIDKVADRVIEKLKQDYSPSPYDPGFNPDKVNRDALQKVFFPEEPNVVEMKTSLEESSNWLASWEQARGFNPEQ